MSGNFGLFMALAALGGGANFDGRPQWSPDPRVPQSPESAAQVLADAEAKRQRKAARRLGGAR